MQPAECSRLHRDLARRDQWPPQAIQAVEQEQPGRTHERFRLGHPNLGSMVIAKRLSCPLSRFRPAISQKVSIGVRVIPRAIAPRPRMTREKQRNALYLRSKSPVKSAIVVVSAET